MWSTEYFFIWLAHKNLYMTVICIPYVSHCRGPLAVCWLVKHIYASSFFSPFHEVCGCLTAHLPYLDIWVVTYSLRMHVCICSPCSSALTMFRMQSGNKRDPVLDQPKELLAFFRQTLITEQTVTDWKMTPWYHALTNNWRFLLFIYIHKTCFEDDRFYEAQ